MQLHGSRRLIDSAPNYTWDHSGFTIQLTGEGQAGSMITIKLDG